MTASARRILLHGAVQGCGLRPALARLAAEQRWNGCVRNCPEGVELLLHGELPTDDRLQSLISAALPASADVQEFFCEPHRAALPAAFQILESSTAGTATAYWPRDQAICRICLEESRDPGNRRYRYPFITCAECGPRDTILKTLPFDRERTTMSAFSMCSGCRREYHDPKDRRFHAQTISCPDCGPRVWAADNRGRILSHDRDAIELAADFLRQGLIVAVRGVGGYQLLVDATSSEAVLRLRGLKQRPAKPLAVLCRSLAEVREAAWLNDMEEAELASPANPIVLLRQRSQSELAAELNPGLAEIGILLPTTAWHDQLLELTECPLVCTSGNREGDPLAYRLDEAQRQLKSIADLFLHHDREIERPLDDSVVRVMANRAVTIRAARGLAPLPLRFARISSPLNECPEMLACGGHQKAAVAVLRHGTAHLGPHRGDLDTLSAQSRWIEQSGDSIDRLVCDPHPGYFPTCWAAARTDNPIHVWHHQAHVVAGMLEHGWLDREVLGVAWDGTGLGPDGTLWGGEILRTAVTDFQRLAYLRPFQLPGGEAAIADLRRTGLAVLSQLEDITPADIATILDLEVVEVQRLQRIRCTPFSPTTTSCGRLFDAAACLILRQSHADFEGHGAMRLESVCDPSATGAYLLGPTESQPLELDWRPVLREILRDRRSGISRGAMAMRFHRGLAQAIIEVAQRWPELPVVCSGGVFQNRVLVELLKEHWPRQAGELGLPGRIPPNDGGLAAGQLAVAVASTKTEETDHVPGSSRPACRLD